MTQPRIMGTIKDYSPYTDELTIKLSFVSPEQQEYIESLIAIGGNIVFQLTNSTRRREKTYAQLRRYFWMLKLILKASEVLPVAKAIKTLDTYIKKTLMNCDYIEFEEENVEGVKEIKRLPIIPSKADMTIEELNGLMEGIEESYEYLNIDWEKGVVVE